MLLYSEKQYYANMSATDSSDIAGQEGRVKHALKKDRDDLARLKYFYAH